MDEPVARAARTEPEVARAPRGAPGADSADAREGGVVSSEQFQVGNSDYTNAHLGVQKHGLRRVLLVLLSQHGKSWRSWFRAYFLSRISEDCLWSTRTWIQVSYCAESLILVIVEFDINIYIGLLFIIETIAFIIMSMSRTFYRNNLNSRIGTRFAHETKVV